MYFRSKEYGLRSTKMEILKISIYIISFVHFVTIVLALIKKDFWIFRIFDYPRMQKFVILSLLLSTFIFVFKNNLSLTDWILIFLLVISLIYLAFLILPFTVLGKKMIKQEKAHSSKVIKVLVANVYQENQKYAKLLDLVSLKDPDIVFLVETNHQWHEKVKKLVAKYPYTIEVPKENTYGMLFFSKYKISSSQVKYLIDPEVPSIETDVEFDGQIIRIFALHPTPPTPNENLYSTDRDAEILTVAKHVMKLTQPCMVIGDLNDVAWSYTTELFLKTSGLLDPRRGRGCFNTFHAKYPLLRWPLDHFFVSAHFKLIDIRVESPIGSDHFPISISLVLSDYDDSGRMKSSRDDQQLASEKTSGQKPDSINYKS
jgi:endonuclease/exonuclease/phosphatase (EEP) superfamily protein YafD